MKGYLILILGLVITFFKDIFNLYKKDDAENVIKKLTVPGRIVTVLGIIVALVGGFKLYENEQRAEKQLLTQKNKMIADSVQNVRQNIVNDSIINGLKRESELSESLLSTTKDLNKELYRRIGLQTQLLKNQEKEILKSRFQITDNFRVNCQFVFTDDQIEDIIVNSTSDTFKKRNRMLKIYPTSFLDSNFQVIYEKEKIVSRLMYDRLNKLEIIISFWKKSKGNGFSLKSTPFDWNEDFLKEKDEFYFYYKTQGTIIYEFESGLFRVFLYGLPLSIEYKDTYFQTLYDLNCDQIVVNFKADDFRLDDYHFKQKESNGKFDFTNNEDGYFNIDYIELSHGLTRIIASDQFKKIDKSNYLFAKGVQLESKIFLLE